MLLKLSAEIQECYRHATECRERAEAAIDPSATADFLDAEERWLRLARNYEFAESLSSFTARFKRKR